MQILYQGKAPCPKYDAMYNKLLTDPDPGMDFYAYNQRVAPLYAYLTEKTGEVKKFVHIHRLK